MKRVFLSVVVFIFASGLSWCDRPAVAPGYGSAPADSPWDYASAVYGQTEPNSKQVLMVSVFQVVYSDQSDATTILCLTMLYNESIHAFTDGLSIFYFQGHARISEGENGMFFARYSRPWKYTNLGGQTKTVPALYLDYYNMVHGNANY
jgi:hypothetical protein